MLRIHVVRRAEMQNVRRIVRDRIDLKTVSKFDIQRTVHRDIVL